MILGERIRINSDDAEARITGLTVRSIEFATGNKGNYVVVTFEDGTTLYADDPTVYVTLT